MYATDRLFFSKHKMNGEASRLSRSAGHPNYSTIASRQTESTRKEKFSCAGILLCMASGMCFLAGNTFTKMASVEVRTVTSWEMLLLRNSVILVLVTPIMVWSKVSPLGPPETVIRLRLGLQAVTANILVLCYYEATMRLPLGDAGAIMFSSPVFTMIMSVFMLRERCGLYRLLVSLVLIAGVIVVSRPPAIFGDPEADLKDVKQSADVIGILAAVLGALLSAWTTIIVKQISDLHFALPMAWGVVVGIPTALIGMIYSYDRSRPLFSDWLVSTWLLGTGQGLLGFVGVILILLALRLISPTQNKVIRSFQVVGSYIVQVQLFGTQPHSSDYVGAALIMVAVTGSIVEGLVISKIRQKCSII